MLYRVAYLDVCHCCLKKDQSLSLYIYICLLNQYLCTITWASAVWPLSKWAHGAWLNCDVLDELRQRRSHWIAGGQLAPWREQPWKAMASLRGLAHTRWEETAWVSPVVKRKFAVWPQGDKVRVCQALWKRFAPLSGLSAWTRVVSKFVWIVQYRLPSFHPPNVYESILAKIHI